MQNDWHRVWLKVKRLKKIICECHISSHRSGVYTEIQVTEEKFKRVKLREQNEWLLWRLEKVYGSV
jgi:hypothetical protein